MGLFKAILLVEKNLTRDDVAAIDHPANLGGLAAGEELLLEPVLVPHAAPGPGHWALGETDPDIGPRVLPGLVSEGLDLLRSSLQTNQTTDPGAESSEECLDVGLRRK